MLNRKQILIACSALCGLLFAGIFCGPAGLGLPQIDTPAGQAILNLRLCRLTAGLLVGAALAAAGCALQTVLRNPLAEPYILGISSGASLGVTLAIITSLAGVIPLALPGSAFAGAILTITLVCLIARNSAGYASNTLILSGVVVGTMLSSLILLLYSTVRWHAAYSVTWWMMGNLALSSKPLLFTAALLIAVALAVLYSQARVLNALVLGHETAYHLGINLRYAIPLILAATTLAVSAAVSISGIIGFVGLIIPHIMRQSVGSDHRQLLPFSAFYGGVFLVLCDLCARMCMAPREIPVGVITALTGGPFFLFLLVRRKMP